MVLGVLGWDGVLWIRLSLSMGRLVVYWRRGGLEIPLLVDGWWSTFMDSHVWFCVAGIGVVPNLVVGIVGWVCPRRGAGVGEIARYDHDAGVDEDGG